jgi:O-antigen chain-terminating methyltransferase
MIANLAEQKGQMQEVINSFQDKLTAVRKVQDNIQHNLHNINPPKTSAGKTKGQAKNNELLANNHSLDVFYTNFEDRFRGDEALITERLKEYLPLFVKNKRSFKNAPVLDIGCGRGEMLGLLKNNQINAMGLDINFDMVARANKKGLKAIQADAMDYLRSAESQSFGAITGFHIVEHIPFSVLMGMFAEAHRTLVENGFVIFETPNPENLGVGASTFYTDPSHLHPLPPDLLSFALESCGFSKVEIVRLHPVDIDRDVLSGLPEGVMNLLYGPRDYAVVGYK